MSQLSPEKQIRDFERIITINPMSLVLLFYAGLTKLENSSVCTLPEISGHGPIFSVYSSVYAIVEVNGRRWELGIKHRR